MMLTFNRNQLKWFSDPDMMAWVDAARLNILHHVTAGVSERACEKIISVPGSRLHDINDKLEDLLAQAGLSPPKLRTDRESAQNCDLPAVSRKFRVVRYSCERVGRAATIDAMTTTPDDQDWLRLADEAFTPPEDATTQDPSEQPRWRYRSPVG